MAETILFPIHNNIQFAGKQIKIDRSSLATVLTNAPSKVIILSGDGGSGKTALIKEAGITYAQSVSLLAVG
ncbi:tRNA (adenosine(37)-N6)-threonylcarbamoyltransferase complex ATPase subunit type 1 TsaE [Pseudoflavitalea sp. X16]|uniref:tRNA (adenosine(37)-N6)-threonylcarbamoyltransferase complex ATPase subunit type 1 TsaE n=1 Tax=Paraflavitalea devenefica TaxID=2716334 RepID=UPI0014229608|nr:tRNA (adenosine(37)-N6)-threonylcarbamoyltransferase complex ATPase subunit type 1 TsaE [Paraflavitalea devenefica]NII28018.1 tRNA (adenosine(37)-N6)-threonylcarbamoyltransferase complex ATPase subunit type 1 TsaE [Paraflavitalea devenefica]